MNLLMVHGNGGGRTRFRLFEQLVEQAEKDLHVRIAELPGFDRRRLPESADYWSLFIDALASTAYEKSDEPWVFYGHGIGGSLLLEWAARDWKASDGQIFLPQRVVLHGCIGASLKERFFPKLMKPRTVRFLIQWLIWQPVLRPFWERKLFLNPKQIPEAVRRQFFQDYRYCAAFPVFFDLITPQWYEEVQKKTCKEPLHFIWGEAERVVASKYLDLWRHDFPNSTFEVVEGWDHFPMLEQPEEFYDKIIEISKPVDSNAPR